MAIIDQTVLSNVSGTQVEVGGGVEASALRVTLANDSTGLLSVDDNGASLTVDGPLTDAELRATPVDVNITGGTVTIGAEVEISNDVGNSIPVNDAGASLTVDANNLDIRDLVFSTDKVDVSGSVLGTGSNIIGFVKLTDGVDTALVSGSGELNVIATAQPGVDIGDVTINNAAGASAVNIQDGGNSITIDDGGGSITIDNSNLDAALSTLATEATLSSINSVLVNSISLDNATPGGVPYTTLAGFIYEDMTPTTVSNTEVGYARMSDNRVQYVMLRDGDTNNEVGATIADLTNSNPLATMIVDANGDQITSFGGGTQYTEDVAAAADPVGNMNMAVRADTLAAVTTTDGDNIALRSTNKGELYVKQTDVVHIDDNSSTISVDDGGGSITIDGSVSISGSVTVASHDVTNAGTFAVQATIASGATSIAKAEDVAASNGDVGVPAMAIQQSTPADTAADGNYSMLQMKNGKLWVAVDGIKSLKTVTSGVTAITTDTDIIAAVASKRIKVVSYALFTDSTTQNVVVFKSNGTGGTALWTVPLQSPASGSVFGANLATGAPDFLFATTAGQKLTIDVSAAVNLWYSITYYDDDAS